MKLAQAILGIALATSCVACGDDAASGGGGSGPDGGGGAGSGAGGEGAGGAAASGIQQVNRFCEGVGDALCEALFACCTDPAELADHGDTLEGCKAEFPMSCGQALAELPASLDDGVSQLDEARLAQCVAQLSADATSCAEPPLFVFFTCLASFHGTVAPGAACGAVPNDVSFIECDGGLCGPEGVCVPYLASGASCDAMPDPEAFCDFSGGEWCSSATMTCEPRADVGDACQATGEKYQCLSLNCVADQCAEATATGICQEGT